MDNVPHLALPLRIVGGQYMTVQQGTLAELRCNVAAIVSFPLGSRVERPEFGIKDPEFEQRPLDTLDIEAAVESYEPRAAVRISELPYDPLQPGYTPVTIAVSQAGAEDAQEES
jgi:phage baseplate assembly protein W